VQWYEKAIPFLSKQLPTSASHELGTHGERFVSVGVSYWHTNHKTKAIEFTQKGLVLMEAAVAEHDFDPRTLSVPYNNLATMHQDMGNVVAAKQFAVRVEEIRTAAKSSEPIEKR
jgi:hypothetical protein